MKNVGFQGGSSIFEVGTNWDLYNFFCIIKREISLSDRELFLINRVFLKYLEFEDVNEFSVLIAKIKLKLFERFPDETQRWISPECDGDIAHLNNGLNWSKCNIFFDAIAHCTESSIVFFNTFNMYKPLRVVASDMPDYLIDKARPLSAYDALDDDDTPFWHR